MFALETIRKVHIPLLLCLAFVITLPRLPVAAQTCLHNGDVNQDGAISPGDALLAFQHFLGIADPPLDACQQERANVDNAANSGVTPADALCIFQRFLRLPSCFEPIIGAPHTFPDRITVNKPTMIRVASEAEARDTLILESVRLTRYDTQGNTIDELGPMYDDGTHGDLLADDGRFTTQITFNEPGAVAIYLRTSAAYEGMIKRVQSEDSVLLVLSDKTPEEVLTELADDLRFADIEVALNKFSLSLQNREALEVISRTGRLSQVADFFADGTLVESTDDFRVYESFYTLDDGSVIKREFSMAKNHLGQWIVISW